MRRRAILWDLDGTLLDTLQDLADAVNHALASRGMPPRTVDEVRRFVGNGVRVLMRRAVPEGTDETGYQAAFAAFEAYYSLHSRDHTAPYPGITAMLETLRDAGCALAVVSNKSEGIVEQLRQTFFPAITVAVGDVPERLCKPAPDSAREAMRRLGVTPEQTLFAGDSDVDIATARAAGLPCLSVTWGFRDGAFLVQHGATVLADTPQQAAQIILKGVEDHG